MRQQLISKAEADPDFYKSVMAVPNVEHIYETLKELKLSGVHIEITNLVVPKIGDSMDRIRADGKVDKRLFGTDTPFHLLRFHPDYKMTTIPATCVPDMEKALLTAKNQGLKLRLPRQRSRSPSREHLLPQLRHSRNQTKQLRNHPVEPTSDMQCPVCGHQIPIKGKLWQNNLRYPYSLF